MNKSTHKRISSYIHPTPAPAKNLKQINNENEENNYEQNQETYASVEQSSNNTTANITNKDNQSAAIQSESHRRSTCTTWSPTCNINNFPAGSNVDPFKFAQNMFQGFVSGSGNNINVQINVNFDKK